MAVLKPNCRRLRFAKRGRIADLSSRAGMRCAETRLILMRRATLVLALVIISGFLAQPVSADDRSVCDTMGVKAPDEAIAACTRLIASAKGRTLTTAYNSRAWAYIGKKEYDRAVVDLNKAIRLDPKSSNAYKNRSFAYDSKGEYDHAIADLNEAIRLDPNNAKARSALARVMGIWLRDGSG
jgi:tetratricopeptide (TPR) repeat protein